MRNCLKIIIIALMVAVLLGSQPFLLLEKEWAFRTLPVLTTESGLHIWGGDNLQTGKGSASLNSAIIAENWNSTQKTTRIRTFLNFVPGDGFRHQFFDNQGTDATTNREQLYIDAAGLLTYIIHDTDSTQHLVSFDVTGWTISTEYQIVAVIDFNNDAIALYTDGTVRDNTPDNALSSDSIDAIEATTQIGANTSQANQLNGVMTFQIFSRAWTSTDVDDDDPGIAFVVDQDTLAMGNYSDGVTSITYYPGQLAISSISTVTLTLTLAADTKLVAGDRVVVYDDDDPANVVYTAVATVSGTTVTVDDSCAAVSGTNKTITRNLWVDGDQESASTGNVSVGANQTFTKDVTTVPRDTRSGKLVWAAADDDDESDIASMTLANAVDVSQSLEIKTESIDDSSKLYLDIDGGATPILTREIGKSLGDNGVFARSFDLDETYSAVAANNTIHDVTTEDLGVAGWVRVNSDAGASIYIVAKHAQGYYFRVNNDGILRALIQEDGAPQSSYILTGNTDLRDGRWHHVAFVIDRNSAANCKIYLDGAEDGTTNKSGTLGDVGSITNTAIFNLGAYPGPSNQLDGELRDVVIAYPADIMAANEMGAAGEIANLYNNPSDPSQWPNNEDYWLCNDNAASTVVTGANNNLTASANTEDFATYNTKRYDTAWQADQAAITAKLRITGAGAGANSATVYLDQGEVLENLVVDGGFEAADGGADGVPDDWTLLGGSTGTPSIETTIVHSGGQSQKGVLNNQFLRVHQTIFLTSGQYYTLSFWYRGANGTAGAWARITENNALASDDLVISLEGIDTSGAWKKVSGTFKSTGLTLLAVQLASVGSDTFYVDDVTLTRLDTAAASTADRNRSFADGKIESVALWDRAMGFEEVQERKGEI